MLKLSLHDLRETYIYRRKPGSSRITVTGPSGNEDTVHGDFYDELEQLIMPGSNTTLEFEEDDA